MMSQPHKAQLLVGVISSSDSFEDLLRLLRTLPASADGMCFLLYHRYHGKSPGLTSLLSDNCDLAIVSVDGSNPVRLTPNTVFVLSGDCFFEVDSEQIQKRSAGPSIPFHDPEDHLLRSIARNFPKQCAAIVLTDGAHGCGGLLEIAGKGGLTLRPDCNRFSALQAMVRALPLRRIFLELKRFSLRNTPRNDRQSALVREIDSQQTAVKSELPDSGELTFFAEEADRESLSKNVLEPIIESLGEGEDFRLWIPGCNTGETAYGLAIQILELLEQRQRSNCLRIFATDTNMAAIGLARRATYPPKLLHCLSSNQLKRYFKPIEGSDSFKIRQNIRNCISFARQDPITDPPFHRLHLVYCRHLTGSNEPHQRAKIFRAFSYALLTDGYLALEGKTQPPAGLAHFLRIMPDRPYYKKLASHPGNLVFDTNLQSRSYSQLMKSQAFQSISKPPAPPKQQKIEQHLLERYAPPTLITHQDGKIEHQFGDCQSYLNQTYEPGISTLFDVLPAELAEKCFQKLSQIQPDSPAVTFRWACQQSSDISANNKPLFRGVVFIEITPLADEITGSETLYATSFHSHDHSANVESTLPGPEAPVEATLSSPEVMQQALAATRQELQSTIEELELSNSELQQAHYRTLESRERVQAAYQDLENSTEELKIINEELNRVNNLLHDKIEQLEAAHNDLENFFTSAELPILFLDDRLQLQRFTPAASQLWQLTDASLGTSIRQMDIDPQDKQALTEDCQRVLETLQPVIREVQHENHWYQRRITPYHTSPTRIEGVVLTLNDITTVKHLSQQAARREQQQKVIADLSLLALESDDTIHILDVLVEKVSETLGAEYCKILQYDAVDQTLRMVSGKGWQTSIIEEQIPTGKDSLSGYTLSIKEPVVVEAFSQEERFKSSDLLRQHGVSSALSCLIGHIDHPFGVFSVHSRDTGKFNQDDASFLVSAAGILSTYLQIQTNRYELREREAEFRTMANAISHMSWMVNSQGEAFWYNDRWYQYTGSTLESMKDWGWMQVLHPDYLDPMLHKFKEHLASGEFWEDTFPIRSANGDYRWFLSRALPIRNADGIITRWLGTNTDVTDQREQAAALSESEKKLRLALEAHHSGAFEYYLNWEETYWDDYLKSLWGIAPDETPTQEIFWKSIDVRDVERVRHAIEAAMNDEDDGHYHTEYRVVNRQTGASTWVEASGQVIFESQLPLKMVGMVIDISERKALEFSLQTAIHELQEADERKNEFLSILGHELRNPLAALSNSLELAKNPSTANPEQIYRIMRHSINAMAHLLDDLLDLNRITRDKIELQKIAVDINQLLKNSIAQTHSFQENKGHRLTVNCEDGLITKADTNRLEQVFTNLVINACKYTPPGGLINIEARRKGDDIIVRFTDNGVGISEDNQSKIFQPFIQITQVGSASSGLGIGLALCKKLMELHNGNITVSSPGSHLGSTFTLSIPYVEAELPAPPPTPQKVDTSHRRLQLVLIEDNETILETFPLLLEQLGCDVRTAANATDGIALCQLEVPDLMFVDIGLPDMSGHECAQKLRDQGYHGELIALSGYSHKEMRDKSLACGFNHHMAKPISLSDIQLILNDIRRRW